MTNYTQNILAIFNLATDEEITNGKLWYSDANKAAQEMADKYELPLHVVVGVIAALSPTNKWERNLVDADNMCSVFVSGGYVEECTVCTYKTMRAKAWSILQAMPEDGWAVEAILKGPKISDFFWCIMGFDTCVIDGHAWCIANADRRTMQEVPSIGKKLRHELQTAYIHAGHATGFTAYEMQAITWVAWRRIHGVA